jgi:hypothetical protein
VAYDLVTAERVRHLNDPVHAHQKLEPDGRHTGGLRLD